MKLTQQQADRLRASVKKAGILLAIGLAYLMFTTLTGWGIPCVFAKTTGLLCPGCGISRMFQALARLDFAAALRCNALVLCLLPFALVFGLRHWLQYVKTGRTDTNRFENVWILLCGVLTLAFWILRNLPSYSFLAP